MRRLTFALTLVGIVTFAAAGLNAQCTKDTDCKGDRICKEGKCVDPDASATDTPAPAPAPGPAPAPASGYSSPQPAPASGYSTAQPAAAPAPAPAPPPQPRGPLSMFQSGYATIALLLSFHGWGGWTDKNDEFDYEEDGDLESDFMPGFRLAGYGVVSEGFHIGGYWTFFKADIDVDPDDPDLVDSNVNAYLNMLGITLKFGARLAERIWLGGAVDVGLMITKGEVDILWDDDLEMKAMVGAVLYPRIDLDILLVDTGAFRLAATAAFGLFVSPITGGHPYDTDDFNDDDETTARYWWLSPALLIGLSLGA